MNLEFGILWIEDSYSDAEEESLRQVTGVNGFEASIRASVDGSDLADLAREQQLYHPFDLVLLDLNLAGGVKGDALALEVRRHFRSTPILFYSGSIDEKALRQRMAEQQIEGVYCAHRSRFVEKAGEVISDLSLSLNRLSGMRGLAMEVVATTDALCKEVILALDGKVSEGDLCKELDSVVNHAAETTIKEFPSLPGLKERLEHRAVDSMKLFKLFRDLLKAAIAKSTSKEEQDRLRAIRSATKDFRDNILLVRNTLGHACEIRTKNGWIILDSNGEVFMTVDDFPVHRRNFLGNLRAIREVHAILVPQKAD